MRRITQDLATTDGGGRTLARSTESLLDDGLGRLRVVRRQRAGRCPTCRVPLLEVTQLRGRCESCGRGLLCEHCASHCRLCARRLCPACKVGSAGVINASVCLRCGQRLAIRQAFEDRMRIAQMSLASQRMREASGLRRRAMALQLARARAAHNMAMLRLLWARTGRPIRARWRL
ncbi:MAG: hypothetical protein ACF8R7_12195 [Phycisphaerales bacterium JB039]